MGFFSQCERKLLCTCTYKVTSAASICMHHNVVTDQHIFKSCMNGVMVVCACMHIRTWRSKS